MLLQDFTVLHPFEYRLPLDGPIVTQRLQIVPLEWNNRYACMSIEAEGCLAEGPSKEIAYYYICVVYVAALG